MPAEIESSSIAWAQNLMRILKDGGPWCVPRSALIFKKQGDTLTLVGRMAHHDAMPISAGSWAEYQQDDYAATVEVFTAAGFKVVDETEGKQT